MKTLTFNIVCSLLFGLEQGTRRERMIECFRVMISGVWSIPINLPFTRYNQSRRASRKIQEMLKELLDEKRVELEEKGGSSHQDLITCLLSIRNEENELVLSEKEIVHNIMLVLVAGFDTSSVLITFMMRNLANNPTVYAAVLQGMLLPIILYTLYITMTVYIIISFFKLICFLLWCVCVCG